MFWTMLLQGSLWDSNPFWVLFVGFLCCGGVVFSSVFKSLLVVCRWEVREWGWSKKTAGPVAGVKPAVTANPRCEAGEVMRPFLRTTSCSKSCCGKMACPSLLFQSRFPRTLPSAPVGYLRLCPPLYREVPQYPYLGLTSERCLLAPRDKKDYYWQVTA